jgi:hypothetical protein
MSNFAAFISSRVAIISSVLDFPIACVVDVRCAQDASGSHALVSISQGLAYKTRGLIFCRAFDICARTRDMR